MKNFSDLTEQELLALAIALEEEDSRTYSDLADAMAADPLSRLSGLSSTSEWIAGAALVIYGVALYAAAGLPDVRRVGMGVLAGNVAFAILVTVVLVAGWLPLTELGVVTTIAFTVATVGFAYAQYLGVRRLA